MERLIKKVGFSSFNGHSWTDYMLLGCIWFHVEREHKFPWISFFDGLPF